MNTNRRNFLKLGALFMPTLAAPTVAYSFLWAPKVKTILFGVDAGFRGETVFTLSTRGRIIATGHFESGVAVVDRWEPRMQQAIVDANLLLTLTGKHPGPRG